MGMLIEEIESPLIDGGSYGFASRTGVSVGAAMTATSFRFLLYLLTFERLHALNPEHL
jgi:hypothetical protein